ncbi:MAG: lysophospholipase [Asgard group archaeon]|nr:lysophospholipase [Asgard group archaeon]
MNQDVRYRLFLCIGLVLVLFPLIMQINADYKIRDNSSQFIYDAYGNKLFTKYYPGHENKPSSDAGVMIFHGMGEDQNSLKLYTRFLNGAGFHVFTTDFSGHGRSSGVIPSGVNSDDILANQILRAKTMFKQLSGLSDSDIFLIGHSMGARAVMKATQIDTNQVNGCILIGSAINVDNVSNDSWIKDLGPNNPASNMYILTGAWDDVQSPNEALKLYQTLAGNDSLTDLKDDYLTPDDLIISINVLKILTHTHESTSFRMASWVTRWVYNIFEHPKDIDHISSITQSSRISVSPYSLLIWYNLLEVIGFFLLLIYGQKIIKFEQEKRNEIRNEENYTQDLFNLKKFYWFKLLIWVGAGIIAIVIAVILLFLPIAIPYFTLLFFCPLAGYGIINFILYTIGKMPGYNDKWKPKIKESLLEINWWSVLFGAIVFVIITIVFSYFLNGFMYHIFPINIRLAWLAIFTIIGTLGFYMFQFETNELRKAYPNKSKITMLNNFIFLLPFIIGAFVILFSGRIIFFLDALHDLILLGLVVLIGNLLQQIWKTPIFTAYMQSFLLFFLLLPRGQMSFMF